MRTDLIDQARAPGEDPAHAPGTTRPALTITEAVAATGAHRATLKRRLGRGDLPGAWQEERAGVRTWLIPVEDLLAAGFRPHAPRRGDPGAPQAPAPPWGQGAVLEREVEEWRQRAEQWRREAEVYRARAEERERALSHLEEALKTVRELGPGPRSDRRRRWWRRNG